MERSGIRETRTCWSKPPAPEVDSWDRQANKEDFSSFCPSWGRVHTSQGSASGLCLSYSALSRINTLLVSVETWMVAYLVCLPNRTAGQYTRVGVCSGGLASARRQGGPSGERSVEGMSHCHHWPGTALGELWKMSGITVECLLLFI